MFGPPHIVATSNNLHSIISLIMFEYFDKENLINTRARERVTMLNVLTIFMLKQIQLIAIYQNQ